MLSSSTNPCQKRGLDPQSERSGGRLVGRGLVIGQPCRLSSTVCFKSVLKRLCCWLFYVHPCIHAWILHVCTHTHTYTLGSIYDKIYYIIDIYYAIWYIIYYILYTDAPWHIWNKMAPSSVRGEPGEVSDRVPQNMKVLEGLHGSVHTIGVSVASHWFPRWILASQKGISPRWKLDWLNHNLLEHRVAFPTEERGTWDEETIR